MAIPHPDHVQMSLGEHLEELRWCVVRTAVGWLIATVVMFIFARDLLWLLERPYVQVCQSLGQPDKLWAMNATAGFLMYMKVAMLGGLLLSSPWVFYQLWTFIAAGLYPNERRGVLVAVPFSALLFVAGAAFFLFVVAEVMLQFFIRFNSYVGLETHITLENHIGMMVNLMAVFGLGFQTPLLVAVLGKAGLVTSQQFAHYRRHVIVGLLILSAFVTSPSPVDQVLLAVPLWLLYELGILIVVRSERAAARREAEEDASEGT